MADIKEITQQAASSAKKVVKSPFVLAALGLGIVALVWNSGNKGESSETVTFSEAQGVSGYPDVSGDVSTIADNLATSMQEMYDTMQDSYLQMQEQNAAQFEQMNEVIDNKISNMEFVQKENISAMEDYSAGLLSTIGSLNTQLAQTQAEATAAKAAAEKAAAEATAAKSAAATATKSTSSSAAKSSSSSSKSSSTKSSSSSGTKAVTSSIVNAVIRGDYGNGQARVNALKKAGYDASAVQAAVNKKLLG